MAPSLSFILRNIRYYVTIEPATFLIFFGSGLYAPMVPQLTQMLIERTYTVHWQQDIERTH